jgi:PQQ-like domain
MSVLRRLPLLAIVLATTAVSGCGGGDESAVPDGAPKEASSFADQWPTPNGDLGNRRVATSEIDSGNVKDLGVAWTVPIKGGGTFGNYASTPIIADGVVYTQDLTSNVKAIDLETGDVKWAKDYNAPSVGPNGVTIGYDKVYGATSDFAFALDIDTGEEVWRSDKLTRNANEGIDMAPAVFDDTLYVSTVPGNTKSFYKGNGAGVVGTRRRHGEGAVEILDGPEESLEQRAHRDQQRRRALASAGFRRQRRCLHFGRESGALAGHGRASVGIEPPGDKPVHE